MEKGMEERMKGYCVREEVKRNRIEERLREYCVREVVDVCRGCGLGLDGVCMSVEELDLGECEILMERGV